MADGIIPVILSGGAGTRLWPLSRAARPKQFLSFTSAQDGTTLSLFQQAVLRCRSRPFDPRPVVVGANDHRFLLAQDLEKIAITADILLEPEPRNTCAAIAAGCLQALTRKTQALVAIVTADHNIPDHAAFREAVSHATPDAQDGHLVTFGIRPDRSTTGYGYMLPGKSLRRALAVEQFIEKPSQEVAERLIAENWLWNSGNFLFRADIFLEELARLEPEILDAVTAAHRKTTHDLGFLRLDAASFAAAPALQIDHAIMEKTQRAAVLPVTYSWADIGSWDGLHDMIETDGTGNAAIGDTALLDASGNLIHAPDKLTALVGVNDMIVVSTRDCLLVAAKSQAGNIKDLVAQLHADERPEAAETPQTFRPWGNYEVIDRGKGYQVKRTVVAPGGVLSLQSHVHRAEHWVVVTGEAEVTIDNQVQTLASGQSAYVPKGAIHRLANHGLKPLVLIEVQTGSYLGEDDIVRHDDIYNRHTLAQRPESRTRKDFNDIRILQGAW